MLVYLHMDHPFISPDDPFQLTTTVHPPSCSLHQIPPDTLQVPRPLSTNLQKQSQALQKRFMQPMASVMASFTGGRLLCANVLNIDPALGQYTMSSQPQ